MSNQKISVVISNYRVAGFETLKASFALLVQPLGLKILDCKYFIQGENRWFSFPSKKIEYKDGRKAEYIPLLSIQNKDLLNQIRECVLEALKEMPVEKEAPVAEIQPDFLSRDTSSLWI